jgi:hypothetical protein
LFLQILWYIAGWVGGLPVWPFYRLFQKLPMGPEEISRLSEAYEQALKAISLRDRSDPLTEMIAKRIIEIGQTGLKDPALISARAIEELGLP